MRTFRTLREMLFGGVAVTLPEDPHDPDGPALIHTVVQLDGDILSRVSPDFMARPQEVVAAELKRHLADVRDAVRPVRRLKAVVEWLGDGVAAIGTGTVVGSAANAVFAEAGAGDLLTVGGIGVVAIPLGVAIPAVLGGQLRQAVNIVVFVGRSGPGRWLLRKLA